MGANQPRMRKQDELTLVSPRRQLSVDARGKVGFLLGSGPSKQWSTRRYASFLSSRMEKGFLSSMEKGFGQIHSKLVQAAIDRRIRALPVP